VAVLVMIAQAKAVKTLKVAVLAMTVRAKAVKSSKVVVLVMRNAAACLHLRKASSNKNVVAPLNQVSHVNVLLKASDFSAVIKLKAASYMIGGCFFYACLPYLNYFDGK